MKGGLAIGSKVKITNPASNLPYPGEYQIVDGQEGNWIVKGVANGKPVGEEIKPNQYSKITSAGFFY